MFAEKSNFAQPMYDKIRFRIQDIGNVGDTCLIVLREVGGERRFPISLNQRSAVDVFNLMNPTEDGRVAGFTIIEKLTTTFGIIAEEVVIVRLARGNYVAQASFNECGHTETIEISVDEALMLSLSLRCPIFVDAALLERQTIDGNISGLAIPLNAMPLSILQEMLNTAIREEEYRVAQVLNNEIQSRSAAQ